MTDRTPAAEWPIDQALVRGLLDDQHPDLAHLPLRWVDHGWDNVMFRLGDALAVRLPRREVAIDGVRHEQTWLPRLARELPIRVPVPVRIGVSSAPFPWPWSVVEWLPGTAADLAPPDPDQAEAMADFLRALHRPASPDLPVNRLRGQPLAERGEAVERLLDDLPRAFGSFAQSGLRRTWNRAVAAPPASSDRLIHGDLHPRNVLIEDGTIRGIADWGDICRGDPALDLASAWMLFGDPAARARMLDRYGASEPVCRRSRGWALFLSAVLLGADARHAAVAEATLRRLLEGRPRRRASV